MHRTLNKVKQCHGVSTQLFPTVAFCLERRTSFLEKEALRRLG